MNKKGIRYGFILWSAVQSFMFLNASEEERLRYFVDHSTGQVFLKRDDGVLRDEAGNACESKGSIIPFEGCFADGKKIFRMEDDGIVRDTDGEEYSPKEFAVPLEWRSFKDNEGTLFIMGSDGKARTKKGEEYRSPGGIVIPLVFIISKYPDKKSEEEADNKE